MTPNFGESIQQPIDVDALDDVKEEEDVYGTPLKQEGEDNATPAPWIPPPSKSPEKQKKPTAQNSSSPYRRPPVHRRHPEDADTEDKVLMTLIDGGMSFAYDPTTVRKANMQRRVCLFSGGADESPPNAVCGQKGQGAEVDV
jgi:hypothetical protein